jgi:hypothetical protein
MQGRVLEVWQGSSTLSAHCLLQDAYRFGFCVVDLYDLRGDGLALLLDRWLCERELVVHAAAQFGQLGIDLAHLIEGVLACLEEASMSSRHQRSRLAQGRHRVGQQDRSQSAPGIRRLSKRCRRIAQCWFFQKYGRFV